MKQILLKQMEVPTKSVCTSLESWHPGEKVFVFGRRSLNNAAEGKTLQGGNLICVFIKFRYILQSDGVLFFFLVSSASASKRKEEDKRMCSTSHSASRSATGVVKCAQSKVEWVQAGGQIFRKNKYSLGSWKYIRGRKSRHMSSPASSRLRKLLPSYRSCFLLVKSIS